MQALPLSFFCRPAELVAAELIGCRLVKRQADPVSCDPLKESLMLKINNRKLEAQIKEILQCTSYASVEKYLIARVAKDHQAVKRGKKLP